MKEKIKDSFAKISNLTISALSKVKTKKTLLLVLFLIFCYFFGGGVAILTSSYSKSNLIKNAENWGLGFDIKGQAPTGNATVEELKKYNAYYIEDTDEKNIYLTFDAGYENGNTPPILDALKKHSVTATFFLVGNYIETEPDLVERMVEEGHIVANHTYSHPDMSKITSKELFLKELEDLEEEYEKVTGEEMKKYYRPPQGIYSEDNLKMADELGYKTFFWSLAYVDWYENDQPTREEALDKLLTRIHPGAIVLLHSTSQTNAEILDELLGEWKEMGYTFKSLDDLVSS